MRTHFTPAEVVELTAAISIFMGFSKIALALGGVPDDLPVMEQPTPEWPPRSPARGLAAPRARRRPR